MRQEFKDIMDSLVEQDVHILTINRDETGIYLMISHKILLHIEGNVFFIPQNTSIKIDDIGISLGGATCDNCSEHCDFTSPIGTEKELVEYMNSIASRAKEEILNDLKNGRPIDISLFKRKIEDC